MRQKIVEKIRNLVSDVVMFQVFCYIFNPKGSLSLPLRHCREGYFPNSVTEHDTQQTERSGLRVELFELPLIMNECLNVFILYDEK